MMHDGGQSHSTDDSTCSRQEIDSAQIAKLIASNDDDTKEGPSRAKDEERKTDSSNRIEPSSHHRFFQRGISISDNAISSHQLSSNYIVRKLSGVLSTLLEIGESRPSNNGSDVLMAHSRVPYMPATFETPVVRRAQSAKISSPMKRASSSGDSKEYEESGATGGFGEEPECSCGACSKWKRPRVLLSSEENTIAQKCDPDWVHCGYYSDLGALCDACAGRPLLDGTCCRHNEQRSLTLPAAQSSKEIDLSFSSGLSLQRILAVSPAPTPGVSLDVVCLQLLFPYISEAVHSLTVPVCSIKSGRKERDILITLDILQASTLSSFDTLYSFTANCSNLSRETSTERLCRICHCSSMPDDPLISPCRCSGTLKFVHMSCLLHWLTICSRKLRRPPICELCLYKYRRRRIFKWHNVRLPSIPRRDLGYLTIFVVAVALMFLSAATSFVCFYIERKFGIVGHTKPASISPEAREWESILSSATLASAIIFFLGLFVAMYAHVKTEVSLARYVIQCWRNNHEWIIEEYRPSRDEHYSLKLEQLRRKINGDDEGSRIADAEETLPLRATVLE
ncbi:E3 ubiquitin-protein ligase MARCH1 [Toxocara canis]|uniref:E3 ubiquitin-protein ligase MARCH1 n=1 Tax=Toxocara canis TaxID=6265 RepID=A0A0B2V2X0_TOXCA|nr:E3 ubiquitin-protein ligase MARCH1 [Toxocara canis]